MCVCVRVCSLRLCVSLCLYACVCVCLYRSRSRSLSPSASPLRLCLHRAQCIFRVSGTNCRQATLLARLSPSLSPPLSLYMHLTLTPPCSFSLYFLSVVAVCLRFKCVSASLARFTALVDHLTLFPLCLLLCLPLLSLLCSSPALSLLLSLFGEYQSHISVGIFHLDVAERKRKLRLSQVQPLSLCVCVDPTPTQAHIFSMQLFANENGKLREQIVYSRNDRRGKWGHIKTGIGGDVGVDDSLAYL